MSEVAGRMAPQIGAHFLERAPGRARRAARRRARRAAGARRRARRGQRRLERGVDRAGHGGRGAPARQEPRPPALGRPDPQGPDQTLASNRAAVARAVRRRRPRDRRGARARRPRAGARHRRHGRVDAAGRGDRRLRDRPGRLRSRASTRRRTPIRCSCATTCCTTRSATSPARCRTRRRTRSPTRRCPYAVELATGGIDADRRRSRARRRA